MVGRLHIVTLAFLFAVSIFLSHLATADASQFQDIGTSYAKDEIIHLYNKKIITGTSATTFSPDRSVTRAEFIAILNRLLGLEPVASPVTPYKDLNQSTWYYGPVQAAVQLELAKGKSATTFAPEESVTRQEAAVWMARALKQSDTPSIVKKVFEDEDRIADWASASVGAVHKLGLIKGDDTGTFRPTDPLSREETAMLMDRVLQNDSWASELEKKPIERIMLGWQYGQTMEQYTDNILHSNVNTLSPRWYFLDKTGTMTDLTDAKLIAWGKNNNKPIWPMVGNRSDQETTHFILTNTTARNKVINQLADMVKTYELEGLNIDFENVAPADRQSFTTFIALLAVKLHDQDAVLSIDVSPDRGTSWTEAFDYAALGKHADYIVMMGYDEHYGELSGAGPNASLPYVTNAVHTLLKVVPGDKVILGMPFYNRDWTLKPDGNVASSAFITLTEQNEMMESYSLKPVWSEASGQYIAGYKKRSVQHMIWFEEGRSLIAKYHLVVNNGLAGAAYWYIGGESSDIWSSLRNAERYSRYSFSNS
ncbi:S-layer homology domain-containing protein [Paenibacillus sp. J5C_2022]|uniref:S-layer homology domain-containing protein n=1 Tax=Paenibacillus sp. J5C2022 TaxID=2977129 RepID=UPI0021D2249C|nr:S-layer homology domain-containing protein [Paenibacillus sp. J5C2022]MCU6711904.1 S-layer homology domain-containing protein [Paenibacillus sp. J5C2022]